NSRCRDKSGELGYALSSMYWGKGITTMLVKQVVEVVAFKEFPYLERLEANISVLV
ncbi:putative N-acetyltransferase, partial [Trifolium medium]|nr:putative N-acetyltransferase [Trifolium medium]